MILFENVCLCEEILEGFLIGRRDYVPLNERVCFEEWCGEKEEGASELEMLLVRGTGWKKSNHFSAWTDRFLRLMLIPFLQVVKT